MRTNRLLTIGAVLGIVMGGSGAWAIPELQLYVEGGTYDKASESWVTSAKAGDIIRLWTIGNVAGPGSKGPISDVKLAVAYADRGTGAAPNIDLVGKTTGGYGGFSDPSTPTSIYNSRIVTDGSTPVMGDGTDLPSHGVYGAGTDWQEFALGNFSKIDSPIGDFITAFPTLAANPPKQGQINVYQVQVQGLPMDDPTQNWLHFDLYDHVAAGNQAKTVFAPFSHDATTSGGGGGEGTPTVPEPTTLVLLGTGLLGLGGMARRKKIPQEPAVD